MNAFSAFLDLNNCQSLRSFGPHFDNAVTEEGKTENASEVWPRPTQDGNALRITAVVTFDRGLCITG
jgi:hypothetical protein